LMSRKAIFPASLLCFVFFLMTNCIKSEQIKHFTGGIAKVYSTIQTRDSI
jgi:hypothetical protein